MTPTDVFPAHLAARVRERDGIGGPLARVVDRALTRIDVAWLAAYRVLFGLALALSMERFLAYGWVDQLLVGPQIRFRFHYFGFGWVEPLSRGAMHGVFWVLVVLGLAIAAGFAFRLTAPLFALGLTFVQLVDVSTYLNHYYLAGLLAWLLALSPANRAWSADAWLARRRGKELPETCARAWLWLLRVQIGVVYVGAALAKAQSDWLVHGQPLGIWLGASTSLPVLGRLFTQPGVPLAMSWFGFLFDATVVLWLSWRRTRPFAYAVLLGFHVLTRLLFDIGMFPVIMSLSALVFFDPSWPRSLARRLGVAAREAPEAHAARRTGPGPSRLARVALGLGALYCVLQVLLPLRTHLYGGNVLWHEQGMRFSWRVMVRAKGGRTTFVVTGKTSGRVVHVNPREYLTAYQENEMNGQPDLILQLAHQVGKDVSERLREPVEVRADSLASLDGRRGAPLVDPSVDLLTVEDSLLPARWILPAPSEPPPPTRPVL